MSLDLGELVLFLKADERDLNRGLDNAETHTTGFQRRLGAFSRYGVAAVTAIGTAAGLLGIKTAAGNEQARIAFTTMLGSAEKAGAFLHDLQAFAASTPFEFPELQQAASSLISAGIEADKVIPIMTTLGDVTSGMGTGSEGVQRATVALQQMSAAGRITGEDLNQLRDAGIPVYDLLAKATGKSKEKVVELAQAGKLGKKELGQMMAALESGDGLERFSGLMEKQSKSLTGMWSTLQDTVGQGTAKAIEPLIPLMKDGLGGAAVALGAAFAVVGDGAGYLASAILTTASVIETIVGFIESNQTTFTILAGIILALLVPAFVVWGTQATIAAAKNVAAWISAKIGAAQSAALQVMSLTLIAAQWVRSGVVAVASAGRQAAAWLISKAGAATTIAAYITAFASMAASWIAGAATALASAASMAAAWFIALGPIGWAIAAIAVIVAIVIKYWDQISGFTKAAWSKVSSVVSGTVSWVIGFVRNNWPLLLAIITGPIGLAVLFIVRNMDRIKGVMSGAWNAVKGAARAAWNGITGIISSGANTILNAVRAIPGKLRSLVSSFGGAGRALINAFVNGMKNAGGIISGIAGNVWSAVKRLINSAIGKLRGALNFDIGIPGPDIHIRVGNQIPYLAAGGYVDRPTLAMIGEAGPEVVVPLSGGRGRAAMEQLGGRGDSTEQGPAVVVHMPITTQETQDNVQIGTAASDRLTFRLGSMGVAAT